MSCQLLISVLTPKTADVMMQGRLRTCSCCSILLFGLVLHLELGHGCDLLDPL